MTSFILSLFLSCFDDEKEKRAEGREEERKQEKVEAFQMQDAFEKKNKKRKTVKG